MKEFSEFVLSKSRIYTNMLGTYLYFWCGIRYSLRFWFIRFEQLWFVRHLGMMRGWHLCRNQQTVMSRRTHANLRMHRRTPRRHFRFQVEVLVGLEVKPQVQVEAVRETLRQGLGQRLRYRAYVLIHSKGRRVRHGDAGGLRKAEAWVRMVTWVVMRVDGRRWRVMQGKTGSSGLQEGSCERGVGVDGGVGPGDGHALTFVFHTAVLEPNLERK